MRASLLWCSGNERFEGIAVLTWVVDDPKDMRYLLDLGVDGIYTRRPDVLVKLRDG